MDLTLLSLNIKVSEFEFSLSVDQGRLPGSTNPGKISLPTSLLAYLGLLDGGVHSGHIHHTSVEAE